MNPGYPLTIVLFHIPFYLRVPSSFLFIASAGRNLTSKGYTLGKSSDSETLQTYGSYISVIPVDKFYLMARNFFKKLTTYSAL